MIATAAFIGAVVFDVVAAAAVIVIVASVHVVEIADMNFALVVLVLLNVFDVNRLDCVRIFIAVITNTLQLLQV